MYDNKTKARQLRKALELLINSTKLTESQSMEISDIYQAWETKLKRKEEVKVGEILRYGLNADNETQLYSVLQEHTPQIDWTPDITPALYKKIGFAEDDMPIWTQPYGQTDAYMKGDVVSHNDKLWVSNIDFNVWKPSPDGTGTWKEKK